MRKIFLAFLLGICYLNAQIAPPTVQYYLEIPVSNNVPKIKSTMINGKTAVSLEFKNKSITDLFKKFKISDFKLAFPGGKGKLLESAYIIECDPKLMEMIINRYSDVFGRFEVIEPVHPLYIPNDLGGTTGIPSLAQPELSFINAPQAWDISKGDNVLLGNSEGAYSLHEDLVGKITNMSTSSPWNSHGTQVATLSAGNTDNGAGIASTGFNSKIITNSNGFSALIPLANNGARVINMSWGTCSNSPIGNQYGQAIIDQVWNMGVVLIAAAGNGWAKCSLGPTAYYFPASFNNVIAVSAVGHLFEQNTTLQGQGNRKDIFENYSIDGGATQRGVLYTHQYNDKVDINAPGFDIVMPREQQGQLVLNQYYKTHGSSFSAPMTMGVVGLMFSANSCLFPDEVESILKLTAVKNDLLTLNLPYQGKIGAGRLNVFDAVDMAKDMSLPFGSVEVKNRIIDRWDFSLRTAPYEINLTNNLVTNSATLNFTARNDIDILSGDYNPSGTGFVDPKSRN